ncbi:hypothetical protein ACR96V_24735 [Pseudomonas aeruginosa]|uniref:hypothetical protein n=1 Tax=Pseudomonas aeruginosa TaxID=287 RepID=UPI00053EDA40|nr:hypothetical protein [Pseudomonas aeruginosa]EJB8391700.1 hypothetical protein [Pseudomonas aeruginosa]KHE63930.1 hypothetical protein D480_0208970 [Pseudomonas aeruginosa]KSP82712.1 hypothetical protein APB20_17315 [Pseudomonas aeruginosa]MBX6195369.1 hypothetical protein [Pseudomonas aeruginosa]MBX6719618.1 hypothetical protein [Pseudomonas aeruginosa]
MQKRKIYPDIFKVVSLLLSGAAGIGGIYVGQSMSASNEGNKVIREKLEVAYDKTMLLPKLALNLNSAATNKLDANSVDFHMAMYSSVFEKYQDEILAIKKISDLYANDIAGEVKSLSECAKEFSIYASTHLILEARDAGRPTISNLVSYSDSEKMLERDESLNETAYARLRCESATHDLSASIARVMRKHI